MVPTMDDAIRQELDQTPEWWDRQFRAVNRAAFPPKPFNPADHEGHSIEEVRSFGGAIVKRFCSECPSDEG